MPWRTLQDMDSLMEAAKTIGESGDMKAMQKLAEKHQQDAQTRMAPIISRIFDQFVPNRSPGVDPEICRALVKEFLTACQRHMPLLAKQSMEAGMKMGSAMAGGAVDASMLAQMEQGMKEYMPQVTKTMSAVLVELINRSDKMADDIFEAMDTNKDGIVPRKEFEKEFLTSMQQIVNMQALAQTAQKVMENLSESDLEQLRSLVDPEMLKQLSQVAVPAVCPGARRTRNTAEHSARRRLAVRQDLSCPAPPALTHYRLPVAHGMHEQSGALVAQAYAVRATTPRCPRAPPHPPSRLPN